MKMPELKAIAKARGIDSPEGDQRKKKTWINALLQGGKKQPSKSITTPKKAKKEGKKQMETPSKVLINNEIHVGETYEFIKGKYKGKTGVVQSVGPKTCKLKVGGELTGNITFDSLVWTGAAQMKTPSKVLINNEIHVGKTYEFIKGKYKGKTGVVQSVGPKTCKLKVGGKLTGNITFDSLMRTKMVMGKKSASKKKSVSITRARGLCIASPLDPLEHTEDDCELVSNMLDSKGVVMEDTYITKPDGSTGKKAVIKKLINFFKKDANMYIVYYSGHGGAGERGETLGGKTGGALEIGYGVRSAGDLTLDDMIAAWDNGRGKRRGLKLVLVVDACFSGKLVSKLRSMSKVQREVLNICIQSAGNARQTVFELEGGKGARHGGEEFQNGVFTSYFVVKNESNAKWTYPKQHPQFYCTWNENACKKNRFDIELAAGENLILYGQPDHR